MANIETWCCEGKVSVHTAADTLRRVVIRVEGSSHNGSLRMTAEEAIALRDQLADALTKLSIERDAQQVSA